MLARHHNKKKGLLWHFLSSLLQCHYSSIAEVTKKVTIYAPFSGGFGLLQRAENRRHMRLEFMSIDFGGLYTPLLVSTFSGRHMALL